MLLNIQCGIYRDCSERGIALPFLSSTTVAMEVVRSREQELDDIPFRDLQAACRVIVVDYSTLPQAMNDLAYNTRIFDSKAVEGEYEFQTVELTKEIERLNPNIKALEECANEEERLKDIKSLADIANQASQRIAREFEIVKVERINRFMKCFKHVEANVHPIYKDLTCYDGFDGGSAYLDLDDADEPYNGGITFTACPPGKCFFPMDLLSG